LKKTLFEELSKSNDKGDKSTLDFMTHLVSDTLCILGGLLRCSSEHFKTNSKSIYEGIKEGDGISEDEKKVLKQFVEELTKVFDRTDKFCKDTIDAKKEELKKYSTTPCNSTKSSGGFLFYMAERPYITVFSFLILFGCVGALSFILGRYAFKR